MAANDNTGMDLLKQATQAMMARYVGWQNTHISLPLDGQLFITLQHTHTPDTAMVPELLPRRQDDCYIVCTAPSSISWRCASSLSFQLLSSFG